MRTIQDPVYGTQTIDDPLLEDVLASGPLQRLADIHVAGYVPPHMEGMRHTRLEHSLGVALLLKRFGADRHEQVAGLLHDVSHPVFSHCGEYALPASDDGNQTEHERMAANILANSEVAAIMDEARVDLRSVLHNDDHVLLERNLPDLCADRLDYALRDALSWGARDGAFSQEILDRLRSEDGQWHFVDRVSAETFRDLFHTLNEEYAGPRCAMMHCATGSYLRYALARNIVRTNDLFTRTETDVLDRIRPHHADDEVLDAWWRRMNGMVAWEAEKENGHGPLKTLPGTHRTVSKSRAVDPLFREGNRLRRLSDVDEAWAKALPGELTPRAYGVRFEQD